MHFNLKKLIVNFKRFHTTQKATSFGINNNESEENVQVHTKYAPYC